MHDNSGKDPREPHGQTRRTSDPLEQLRQLLIGKERRQLDKLLESLDDSQAVAQRVSQVLPDAIRLRNARDRKLTDTLTPTVQDILTETVKKDPRPLVNALSPVIGAAIRRAVSEALRRMIQSLNQILDHSFSLKSLKWRLEAARSGRPFSEIALLHSLGIRLVLVHGTRPQIEERLSLRGADMQVINGMRVTDEHALLCVKEAAGTVRVEIEALLSTGLANSPMSGAQISVDSGNFVTAKPLGIIDGVDYLHTGEVRKINTTALQQRLDAGAMVLISPLGYSPTGEVFNLNAADVAAAIATEIRADKLIFLTDNKLVDSRRKLIESMVPAEADALLARRKSLDEQLRRVLANAAWACRHGVSRTHILPRKQDGVLLAELFTRDGSGTLITAEQWETLRQASIDDEVYRAACGSLVAWIIEDVPLIRLPDLFELLATSELEHCLSKVTRADTLLELQQAWIRRLDSGS